MCHGQNIAKLYMNINNNNELQTHQGMDSKHVQKDNCSDKKVLGKRSTQYKKLLSIIDLHAMLTKYICIHVHDFGGKYLCISNYHGYFNLIIFRANHISLTLKRIP